MICADLMRKFRRQLVITGFLCFYHVCEVMTDVSYILYGTQTVHIHKQNTRKKTSTLCLASFFAITLSLLIDISSSRLKDIMGVN